MAATTKTSIGLAKGDLERRYGVKISVEDDGSRIVIKFPEPLVQEIAPNTAVQRKDMEVYDTLYGELEKFGYAHNAHIDKVRFSRGVTVMTYGAVFLRNDVKADLDRKEAEAERARLAEEQRLKPTIDEVASKYGVEVYVGDGFLSASLKEPRSMKLSKDKEEAKAQVRELSQQSWGGVAALLRKEGYEQESDGVLVTTYGLLRRRRTAIVFTVEFGRKQAV